MDQFCAQYRRVRVEDDVVPFLKELGRTGICSVLKMFSLSYTEDCVIKSRECLFLALRNFTEELLFKHVLKQKHELPIRDKSRRASEEETA